MFSTDFIFRQQENLVDNQKCQAGFRPLCNKILLLCAIMFDFVIIWFTLTQNFWYLKSNKLPIFFWDWRLFFWSYVVMQDICNKFIELNFYVGCMVSQLNCLLQCLTTMSLINNNKINKISTIIQRLLSTSFLISKDKMNRKRINYEFIYYS